VATASPDKADELIRRAHELASQIRGPFTKAQVLLVLATQLIRYGYRDLAHEIEEEARACAEDVTDSFDGAKVLLSMLRLHLAKDAVASLDWFIRDCRTAIGKLALGQQRELMYIELALALAEAGRVEEGLSILLDLPASSQRGQWIEALMRSVAERDLGVAIRFAEPLEGYADDLGAWRAIIHAAVGRKEYAFFDFAAGHINDALARGEALRVAAFECLRVRDWQLARRLIIDALCLGSSWIDCFDVLVKLDESLVATTAELAEIEYKKDYHGGNQMG
jgi:hypothetical protein